MFWRRSLLCSFPPRCPLLIMGISILVVRKGRAFVQWRETVLVPLKWRYLLQERHSPTNRLSVRPTEGTEAHLQSRPVAGCMAGRGETNHGVFELLLLHSSQQNSLLARPSLQQGTVKSASDCSNMTWDFCSAGFT